MSKKNYHFVHHHRSASWSIVLQLQHPLDIYSSSSDDDDDHPGAIMQDVDLKNKILELPPSPRLEKLNKVIIVSMDLV